MIDAGGGNDNVEGNAGNDTIRGGDGSDTLRGGNGADVFVYDLATDSTTAARDTISDFEHGVDRLSLHSSIGEITFTYSGNTTILHGADGFEILVVGRVEASDVSFYS